VRFAFIDVEKATWPVVALCRALQVSPSGYYAWKMRPESARAVEDRRLRVRVGEAHQRSRATYGSPRLHAELHAQGLHVSRKRVARLMRELGVRGRSRRRFAQTTDSAHAHPTFPNVLARDFTASRPNERWVGDVTYLRTPQGWLYLAAILDLYSRRVVGWATSAVNDRRLAIRALQQAVRERRPSVGLLHHTDQGSPYASEDYQQALQAAGVTCSMSRRGNCIDNAAMETWFATLKSELGEAFASVSDAARELFDYIEVFYNRQRRHSALGYLGPAEFERQALA
jgi:transposase InsO family protein